MASEPEPEPERTTSVLAEQPDAEPEPPSPEEVIGHVVGVNPGTGIVIIEYDEELIADSDTEATVCHNFALGRYRVATLQISEAGKGRARCERISGRRRIDAGDPVRLLCHRCPAEPDTTDDEQ